MPGQRQLAGHEILRRKRHGRGDGPAEAAKELRLLVSVLRRRQPRNGVEEIGKQVRTVLRQMFDEGLRVGVVQQPARRVAHQLFNPLGALVIALVIVVKVLGHGAGW